MTETLVGLLLYAVLVLLALLVLLRQIKRDAEDDPAQQPLSFVEQPAERTMAARLWELLNRPIWRPRR